MQIVLPNRQMNKFLVLPQSRLEKYQSQQKNNMVSRCDQPYYKKITKVWTQIFINKYTNLITREMNSSRFTESYHFLVQNQKTDQSISVSFTSLIKFVCFYAIAFSFKILSPIISQKEGVLLDPTLNVPWFSHAAINNKQTINI